MNRCMGLFSTLSLMLAFGCSDYTVSKVIEYAPEIEVSPESHDFGALNAGVEVSDIEIVISNIGNEELSISSVSLGVGSSNFSLSSLLDGSLSPSESTSLFVTYDPLTYEINSNSVIIQSNDDDEPEVIVKLDGSGDAPVIDISPEYYDFGTILIGCEGQSDIKISNIGNANLEISDIEYFVSVPVDFDLYANYDGVYGELPWTLAPSDSVIVTAFYTPLDLFDDDAYVEVMSSDPLNPVVQSDHSGLGDYEGWVLDNFTQDGEVAVDILFVVDNSGSMSSNQTNLKNNFDDFIAVYVGAGVDYHIALITTDDASFVGNIITPAESDPAAAFNDQIDLIGYGGNPYEKGLWYSYVSTDTGGDASPGSSTGFLRESAKLVVVYVSDEPDFSHSTSAGGGSSSMVTSDYSSHLLSLKSSSDLVVAHAVAGDYPSGCSTNGHAQFGDGYYDVVTDLGGTFMSICAADWSTTMDTLARESMAIMTFPLSNYPVENTIVVEVDGSLSTDWSYDSSANSVSFTVSPPDGSNIDITYATWADCEKDTGDTGQ